MVKYGKINLKISNFLVFCGAPCSIASSSCMCMWKMYVQYTDIVYWKSCVQILCDVLWRIVCLAPESPNNKTIITIEPIEIPLSFMLRCWSI